MRVNRYLRGDRADPDAEQALRRFRRFPTWMWRNADVLNFVGWLRDHNDACRPGSRKVGFYGIDLYSLAASMAAVVDYLERQGPTAAARARERYECLAPYTSDSAAYGRAILQGVGEPCRRSVVEQLVELRRAAGAYLTSHYLHTSVAYQFDALVHMDRTRAVEPLEPGATWQHGKPPETYPTAL